MKFGLRLWSKTERHNVFKKLSNSLEYFCKSVSTTCPSWSHCVPCWSFIDASWTNVMLWVGVLLVAGHRFICSLLYVYTLLCCRQHAVRFSCVELYVWLTSYSYDGKNCNNLLLRHLVNCLIGCCCVVCFVLRSTLVMWINSKIQYKYDYLQWVQQSEVTRLTVSRVWSVQWFRFQWPWMTLNVDFKVTEMPSTNCVRSWRAICLR